MPSEEYFATEGVNQSGLKMYVRDPGLYKAVYIDKSIARKPPTPSQQFGLDCETVLSGRKLPHPADSFVPLPDEFKQRRGIKYSDWESTLKPGISCVTRSEWRDMVNDYNDKIEAFDWVVRNIESTRYTGPDELSAFNLIFGFFGVWHQVFQWDCQHSGLWRKAELDLVFPDLDIVVDVKTTASIDPTKFARDCWTFGYGTQAATYCEAYRDKYGREPRYFIVAIQNTSSYQVAVYELTREKWLNDGDEFNRYWMPKMKHSIENDDWQSPLTKAGPQILDPPAWAKKNEAQFYEMIGDE